MTRTLIHNFDSVAAGIDDVSVLTSTISFDAHVIQVCFLSSIMNGVPRCLLN